jgi:hypothetical protein
VALALHLFLGFLGNQYLPVEEKKLITIKHKLKHPLKKKI